MPLQEDKRGFYTQDRNIVPTLWLFRIETKLAIVPSYPKFKMS